MYCPHCNVELRLADRQGVEIDYCAQCRGVWLDRGELEKLIERSTSMPYEDERYAQGHDSRAEYRGEHHGEGNRAQHRGDKHQGEQRRKSFLGELFDF